MSFHRGTIGCFTALRRADSLLGPGCASETYSFSGLVLKDWTNNGLKVTLSGTVTIPECESFGSVPPSPVDIDVDYDG
jgi:hypothetical protein